MADFKYGDEYQFGALDWHASWEEVEKFFKCSLEPIPGMTPSKQSEYSFYRLVDTAYFYDGNRTTDRIEFKNDKLSMIQFNFMLEDPEGLSEIVAVLQENFGPESKFYNKNGQIGYQWKTDTSMLQIIYLDSKINLFVGTLELE